MKKYILLFFSLVIAFFIIVVPIIRCTQTATNNKPQLTFRQSATPSIKTIDSLYIKHALNN